MKILYLGHGQWACNTLDAVHKAGYDICGVVCETDAFDAKETEHYKRFASVGCYSSLKDMANGLDLDVYQPENINDADFVKKIDAMAPDVILCVSYHAIIKGELLKKYEGKILNLHGAPLPMYRGRSPINWGIINGEDHTGVTIHYISRDIDKGDIIGQKKVPIAYEDSAIDVLQKTLHAYPELALETLKNIKDGTVTSVPQNPYVGTYFSTRSPDDGRIDFTRNSADIYNMVRALTFPYHGAHMLYKGKKLIFWDIEDPKEPQRISPYAGIIFGVTKEGYVKITTGDSYIIAKDVQFEGEDKKNPAKTIPERTWLLRQWYQKRTLDQGS